MSTREQELATILDNLERSYTPSDPNYRFCYVFYNVVNTPFERPLNFPHHLWNQALLPDRTLMPVILNRQQIVERKEQQDSLAQKLNEAHSGLQRRIASLKSKRESIKSKLMKVCQKYRKLASHYVQGEPVEDVYKLHVDTFSREPYVVKAMYDELVDYLISMKEKLQLLEKRADDALAISDKQRICRYKLDRQ